MKCNELYEEIRIKRPIVLENISKSVTSLLTLIFLIIILLIIYLQLRYKFDIQIIGTIFVAFLTISVSSSIYLGHHFNSYLREDKRELSYLNFLLYELKTTFKTISSNERQLLVYDNLSKIKEKLRFPLGVKKKKFEYIRNKDINQKSIISSHLRNHEDICKLVQLMMTYNAAVIRNDIKTMNNLKKRFNLYYDLYNRLLNYREAKVNRIISNYNNSIFFSAKIDKKLQNKIKHNFDII